MDTRKTPTGGYNDYTQVDLQSNLKKTNLNERSVIVQSSDIFKTNHFSFKKYRMYALLDGCGADNS